MATIKKTITSFNPDLRSTLKEREEGHYLFIIADLKKASFFLFDHDALEIVREIMDPSVNKKIKSNTHEMYGRSTKYDHKIDNQIQKHLQLIAARANELLRGRHINGIFIGGHKTMFAALEKELPADLRGKVRGEFITELNIPQDELIEHARLTLSEYLSA